MRGRRRRAAHCLPAPRLTHRATGRPADRGQWRRGVQPRPRAGCPARDAPDLPRAAAPRAMTPVEAGPARDPAQGPPQPWRGPGRCRGRLSIPSGDARPRSRGSPVTSATSASEPRAGFPSRPRGRCASHCASARDRGRRRVPVALSVLTRASSSCARSIWPAGDTPARAHSSGRRRAARGDRLLELRDRARDVSALQQQLAELGARRAEPADSGERRWRTPRSPRHRRDPADPAPERISARPSV